MQGDMVIVRAFGGEPLVRRIWEEAGRGVYITTDTIFENLLAGDTKIQPVGFPREDVFKFDPEIAAAMDTLIQIGKWDWTKLVPV
ncbi:MAG: hypothetical protein ACLPT6_13705 [Desulfobaccales bacterium]